MSGNMNRMCNAEFHTKWLSFLFFFSNELILENSVCEEVGVNHKFLSKQVGTGLTLSGTGRDAKAFHYLRCITNSLIFLCIFERSR